MALPLPSLCLGLALVAQTSSTATTGALLDEDDLIIIIEDGDTFADDADVIDVDPDAPNTPDPFWVRARVSARFDSRLAVDTSFDRAGEHVALLSVGGGLELDVDFAESLAAFAAPNFNYVAALTREGDDRSQLYYVTPEAWVRYSTGGLSLRVGSMTFAWGTSDFIAPNDVLNPVDMRQSPLGLTGGTKIPIVAAEGTGTFGPITLRGVVAPFFASSRFHLTSWDFSVLSVRPLIALPAEVVDAAFSPAYVDHNGDEVLITERPSQRIDNATLAARATANIGDLDISVTTVHGWDNFPRVIVDDDLALVASKFAQANAAGDGPPLTDPEVLGAIGRLQDKSEAGQTLFKGELRRRTVFGFDATYAIDPFVLKVDVAYTLSRTLYDQNFRPIGLPWLNAVIGAEYYWSDRLQVIVEAFGIVVRNVPNNVRLSYLEGDDPPPSALPDGTRSVFLPGIVTAIVYTLMDGDLRLELGAMTTLTRGDFGFAPSINWRVDDHQQLTLGALVLEGRDDGLGGAYTHTDQVYVGYRFAY